MRRRIFLTSAGAVTVAVIGSGVWRACDQGVFSVGAGPAYEPWKDWQTGLNEGALALVKAAILAASPHNTQPWLFKVTDASIELYLDAKRNVGALDPYLREEHIGIGCALENLLLAANANGYKPSVTLFNGALVLIPAEPNPVLLARIDLASGRQAPSELYDAIPRRHTNRSPFLPHRPIPSQFLDALRTLPDSDPGVRLFLFTEEADRSKIVRISSAANTEIYSDPEVNRASGHWIRTRWSDVQSHGDGLTIDAFGLPPTDSAIAKEMPLWMLKWAFSKNPRDGYSKLMLSAPLIGILAVHDRYGREDCLRAGRIWQRAHLLATAHGLAGRPSNEAVEMIDYERAHGRRPLRARLLGELLGDSAWEPTFVFYMGYPTLTAPASPRRPVENVIL
jgi:nitroreductase